MIERSYDLYDGSPNDPISNAQVSVYQALGARSDRTGASAAVETNGEATSGASSTSISGRLLPDSIASRLTEKLEMTPQSSIAGTPAPEAENTPQPNAQPPGQASAPVPTVDPVAEKISLAEERDRLIPVIPLDTAILTAISHGSQADERKTRDFLGGIMLVGGGTQIPGFTTFLEERLKELKPAFAKDIMIGAPPRELDPQVVIWKGASVFGQLPGMSDSWIGQLEYDRLGSRVLPYKCMWVW